MPVYEISLAKPDGDGHKLAYANAEDESEAREAVLRTESKIAAANDHETWTITKVTVVEADA